MLQDKKSETDAEKIKALLRNLVAELSRENPELYYQPTGEVARVIKDQIMDGSKFNAEERALLEGLSTHDLEVLLSLH